MTSTVEVSVVLPCLNEVETLGKCIQKAQSSIQIMGVFGEVVVADNGSTDGSQELALSLGARVVQISEKGYGNALKGGFQGAKGKYIVMGDADDSYFLEDLEPFIIELRKGFDLVMGNRFAGTIEKGAMPPLHYWVGNPTLSLIGRVFFKSDIRDFHCGMRGMKRESVLKLNLQTTGMEFASELVVKFLSSGMKISQVPTNLRKDGRSRPPHLRTWRDGWRHLRFLLSYSPRWLFLYPGLVLTLIGAVTSGVLLLGPVHILKARFDLLSLMSTTSLMLLGFQTIWFAILSKASSVSKGFLPGDPKWDRTILRLRRESNYFFYGAFCLSGFLILLMQFLQWKSNEFLALNVEDSTRMGMLALVFFSIGLQSFFSQFLLNILLMGTK
jgi:glycosyltransferase involved in cell wall biosynthesis